MSPSERPAPSGSPQRVVVGVDGSASSDAAVAWADRYAGATGAQLELVAAWNMPSLYGSDLPIPDDFDPEAHADRLVERARKSLTLPPERVGRHVIHGTARSVLVEEARHADLIVLGSRGHSTVAGLVLGSVSAYCLRHAQIPVVIVR